MQLCTVVHFSLNHENKNGYIFKREHTLPKLLHITKFLIFCVEFRELHSPTSAIFAYKHASGEFLR